MDENIEWYRQLISDNFSKHAFKIPTLCDSMSVIRLENVTYADCGTSCDTFNLIYIHSSNLLKSEIHQAIQHFKTRKRDYCVWIAQENLDKRVQATLDELGLKLQAQEKGMILDLQKMFSKSHSDSLKFAIVKNTPELIQYAKTIASNWSPPDQNVITYYQTCSNHYLDDKNDIILLTCFYNDIPISTVEMFPTDQHVMGLYGFATLEEYRGKGVGTEMMRFCLKKASELGYKRVVLQGTDDGLGIYKKHGFKTITSYFEYA